LDDQGSIAGTGTECFSSPPRLGQLWDPFSLLYNVYMEIFPGG